MIIVLTGATGTGKSSLALEIAKKKNAEIINADAFQVYEGLRIATAAPSEEMKKEVPHHLFSFVPLNESYDIHRYQIEARKAINDIISRGKTPLFVGGSGLYIRSALYDYDLSVDTSNVDFEELNKKSDEELYDRLLELDPSEAKKLHPHNRVRVIRDIAICLASGESKTSLIAKQSHKPIYPTEFFSIVTERDSLYKKVEERVDLMFASGLLEETLPLIEKYGREAPAFRAIGVKELFPYLDGKITLDEAKSQIKEDTRHYIKRQDTFFRHQFEGIISLSAEEVLKQC